MDSHELARRMRHTADQLLSRPAFACPAAAESFYLGNYYSGKEEFLAAARGLVPLKKTIAGCELHIHTDWPGEGLVIWASVLRDTVCRKVQEEKWECEPLLAPQEQAELAQLAAGDWP